MISVHEPELDLDWWAGLSRPSARSGHGIETRGPKLEVALDRGGALEAQVRPELVVPEDGAIDAPCERIEDDLGEPEPGRWVAGAEGVMVLGRLLWPGLRWPAR